MNIPSSQTKADHYDDGKCRMDLIPPEAIRAMGEVFRYGANKYSDHNWARGMEFNRLFASVQRHLWAWEAREDKDTESGLPHLHHALTSLAMLVALVERRPDLDDRPSAWDGGPAHEGQIVFRPPDWSGGLPLYNGTAAPDDGRPTTAVDA